MMVDVGNQKGVIDEDEKLMIQNVFEFDDLTVGEIATHRTDMVILKAEQSMDKWDKIIRENRHSVFPICDGSVDNIVGALYTRDYFRLTDKSRETVMKQAVRPVYFVPKRVKADVLFQQMQQSRNHFSVVSDDYGGVLGVVTMSDLLEQLVGDLNDGEAQPLEIEKMSEGAWKIQGSAYLDEVALELGVSLPDEEYDTFGGYVFGEYGTIPDDGTQIQLETDDLSIHVTSIKDHRMESAVVTVKPKEDRRDGE